MKQAIYLAIFFTAIFCSCKKQQFGEVANSDREQASLVQPMVAYTNKWGAIVNKSAASEDSTGWSTQVRLNTAGKRVAAASALGVAYYRMQLDAKDWLDPTNGISYQNTKINEYLVANQNNLKVMLNILWQSTDNGAVNFASGNYSTSSSEMFQFGKCVKGVLHKCDSIQYKPAFIVVENEEDNQSYYNIANTGQIEQYEKELSTAKAVCDTSTWWNSTTGVPCTNGGITAKKNIYATYHYNTITSPNHTLSYWQSWAYSVLPLNYYYGLIDQTPPAGSGITKASNATILNQISIVDSLLYYYKNTANLSYVNMHWYEPIRARDWDLSKNGNIFPFSPGTYGGLRQDTVVANGLTFARNFLSAQVPTANIMSNELGQLRLNTCLTQSLMYTANANLAYVVLYDGDDDDYSFGAKAYHNTTSLINFNLRSTGTTVNSQIQSSSPGPCVP